MKSASVTVNPSPSWHETLVSGPGVELHKVEHRLFSHITMNWRGRPLSSHQVVVQIIAATSTRAGLKVKAMLDENTYPTGLRITDR